MFRLMSITGEEKKYHWQTHWLGCHFIISCICGRGNVFVVCVCVCLCLCLCLCVCLGCNYWTNWHRNFILVWWYLTKDLRQFWVSRSLGQGHLLENANFTSWTSVLTWFDMSVVKVMNEIKVIGSRSSHGKCYFGYLDISLTQFVLSEVRL